MAMKREIEKILEFTAIAPSSHNTQPWFVKVKDATIYLFADFSRSLHYSDPENRELYVSLGTALQNTLYAIRGFGFDYKLKYFPRSDNELVAEISVNLAVAGKLDEEILSAMRNRHSNRNPYENRDIPEDITDSWHGLINDLGVKLHLVREKKEKGAVAELVAAGTIDAMKDNGFKNELSKWVRNNWTRAHDGMPGYGFNMPTIMSLLSPIAIKYFNIGSMQANSEKTLVKSSSVMAIIAGENETLSWVKAGQAYERVVLDATKKGIKSATMTAAVEIGEYHKELMKIFRTKERPLVMFRLGYSDKIPKETPKRTVSEILRN
jgi:hypothetical protein